MKKYIGTKQVEAEPMTMGQAYEKGFLQVGRVPSDVEQYNTPGYHVKYADGYESWSPAKPFEEAYKLADTALDRMLIEGEELTVKLEKLQAFIGTDKFDSLDEATKAMLVAQAKIMTEYQCVLNQRYTKMESGNGGFGCLPFSIAINLLEAGFVVRRSMWNGTGMCIIKQVPAHITELTIPNMQSLPQQAKDLIMRRAKCVDYASQCLIYNTKTGRADSWNPSIADVFAEDWEIVL
mgnify:CR=1 FL=1